MVVNTWYRFEEPHNLLKNLGLVRLAAFEPATSCSRGNPAALLPFTASICFIALHPFRASGSLKEQPLSDEFLRLLEHFWNSSGLPVEDSPVPLVTMPSCNCLGWLSPVLAVASPPRFQATTRPHSKRRPWP